ncbi:MAG: Ig domain-containing protein, partial [Candidatus Korobacteraceae bacterium]
MFNELVWGASQQGEAFEKLGEHLASRHSSTLGLRAGATLRWLLLASCLVLAVSLYGQSSSKDYIRLGGRVIAIENQGVSITTASSLPPATLNAAYTTTISVNGGTAPYSWSWAAATGSSLPTGLSLGSSCTSTTCAISGTPTSAGTYSAVVSVMDANKLKTSSTFQITVASGPAITTTSPLPPASISTAYTTTISVTGGTAPYSWSWAAATGSSLPTGLLLGSSCSSTTCTVSGTPASAGTYSVVVTVTDANQLKTNSTFQITVSLALNITTTSLPGGTVNSSYSATVAASGGTTPYSWSAATGSLAPGLSLASSTGAISGITITGGTFSPTITVTDAKGATAVKTFQITVATSPLTILTSTTATTSAGGLFVIGLNASGGTTPYTWSVSAVQGVAPLPAVSIGGNASQGWTLNFQSANSDSGNYTFVVTVMDSSQPALTTGSTFMFTVSPSGVSVSDNSPVAYAGGTDIVSARNPSTGGLENANWALTGVGSISPTSNVSQTTYAAPVPVTPDQVVSVTATAGGASASVTVTLELPATTVTPSTGTLYTGQPITFTVSGMGDSWSTTNNYMFLNVTPVASGFYFDFA